MTRAIGCPDLAGALLSRATLAGCSVTQPVAETAAQAVVTQLPGSFQQIEARQFCLEHAAAAHGQGTDAELDREVEAYQAMVEASLIYRAETLQLVDSLTATMASGCRMTRGRR